MEFTVTKVAGAKKGDFVVSRISTIAQYFFRNRIAIDGKVIDTMAGYEAVIANMAPDDRAKAGALATKICAADHERRELKALENSPRGKWVAAR